MRSGRGTRGFALTERRIAQRDPIESLAERSSDRQLDGDRLLTTSQAARMLGVSPATVKWWRTWAHRGPDFVKLGPGKSAVRYSLKALRRFIAERTRSAKKVS
jgi:Helix-turn-helix domain